MSELRKLREAVYDLATDGDEVLTDEQWYDRLWKLLDPVIDARAERQLAAAVNAVADETRDAARCPVTWNPGVWPYTTRCVETVDHGVKHVDRHGNTFSEEQLPTHDAGEYRDPITGEVSVEAHRFTFEGSTTLLARHLVDAHDALPGAVEPYAGGLSQGAWVALDDLHRAAHETPKYKNWGVAWFSKNGESGVCKRCQLARRVYQGYNGGAHIGKFCAPCIGAVLRNEA